MISLYRVAVTVIASSAAGTVGIAAIPPVLGAIGFTSTGVAAGSAAAGFQAGLGGVVASGSWFALGQSVAAGGATAATLGTAGVTMAASSAVGAVGMGVAYVAKYFR